MKINLDYKSKYFTIKEMLRSETAERLQIDNSPTELVFFNLCNTLTILDKIREVWGKPIYVNSGYRCKELNEAVGGSKYSYHLNGQAADITTGNSKDNIELYNKLIEYNGKERHRLNYDKLINEKNGSWLHVQYMFKSNHNRNLAFEIK